MFGSNYHFLQGSRHFFKKLTNLSFTFAVSDTSASLVSMMLQLMLFNHGI